MEKLSTYMSEASGRELPDEVTEKTKQHILDTVAAMISGSELTPGRVAVQFAGVYGGRELATVVASKIVCGPIEAALTNGVLAHADETDDSHAASQSHPGCAVVPAALAAGERFGISGTHFLRAVTLGYDVGTRVTMTLVDSNSKRRVIGARTASLLYSARLRPPAARRALPLRRCDFSWATRPINPPDLAHGTATPSTSRKHSTLAA